MLQVQLHLNNIKKIICIAFLLHFLQLLMKKLKKKFKKEKKRGIHVLKVHIPYES